MTKNFGRNKPRPAEKARTDPGFFLAVLYAIIPIHLNRSKKDAQNINRLRV